MFGYRLCLAIAYISRETFGVQMKVTIKTYNAIKWALVAIGCIGLVLLFLDITDWGVVLLFFMFFIYALIAP